MALKPLIAICGTTGVGKSNLAIELALKCSSGYFEPRWRGAKVINADSMQVYEGLDVITNKVPESERKGVEHLLMGFKKPGEQYVVGEWVQDALKLIDEIHNRNEIPIVVGGTSYWIQHLLFPNRLARTGSFPPPGSSQWTKELTEAINSLPSSLKELFQSLPEIPPSAKTDPEAYQLHALLASLDPLMAERWHWRDTRKVLRSLQIIKETRRRASGLILEQSADLAASTPRFRTLCLWLYAEPSILESRLDARVDSMINSGLLNEIHSLRLLSATPQSANASSDKTGDNYTVGIYQSIGYKEFSEYLNSSSQTDKMFKMAVERMKLSTKQYAKRQISWIRNKLLPAVLSANSQEKIIAMYLLDATELEEQWETDVLNTASSLLQGFLDERDMPDAKSFSSAAEKMLSTAKKDIGPSSTLRARRKVVCSVCTIDVEKPIMIEEGYEWEQHQKTRFHKRHSVKSEKGPNNHNGYRKTEKEEPTSSSDSDFIDFHYAAGNKA